MKTKYIIVQLTSGALIPILMEFLGKALEQMIPWFIAMLSVIIADLVSGLWKSLKLNIPVRFSKACRETMGKMIVYFAFVMMAACINVAEKEEFDWCRWVALFVIVIEFGSMASNVLKPHGVNISLSAIIRAFLHHSLKELSCPEIEDIVQREDIKDIREQELEKYKDEHPKHHRHGKKGDNTETE